MDKKDQVHLLNLLGTGAGFGLEKESLRVREDGTLADTRHPFPGEKHFDRDFCEAQLEIITDVYGTPEEACEILRKDNNYAKEKLRRLPTGPEYLWPFSNPPYIKNPDTIPIAEFDGDLAGRTQYRRYLAAKYGRKLMLLSGNHVNYSYPEEFITEAYRIRKRDGSSATSLGAFRDALYLKLGMLATKYSWLIVALTAASPLSDPSYWEDDTEKKVTDGLNGPERLATIRTSRYGYWNQFVPVLDYTGVRAYVSSIRKYIDAGLLCSAKELYYPVRLKPYGDYSLEAFEGGIDHIELRTVDLNPLSSCGIMEEDVEFLQQLIVWMTFCPDLVLDGPKQQYAVRNCKEAAKLDLDSVTVLEDDGSEESLIRAGYRVLDSMELLLGKNEIIDFQRGKLMHREERYAERIIRDCGGDYLAYGMRLARGG